MVYIIYTLSEAWSGVNWADLMAAQGAFGTVFIHSAPSQGLSGILEKYLYIGGPISFRGTHCVFYYIIALIPIIRLLGIQTRNY